MAIMIPVIAGFNFWVLSTVYTQEEGFFLLLHNCSLVLWVSCLQID